MKTLMASRYEVDAKAFSVINTEHALKQNQAYRDFEFKNSYNGYSFWTSPINCEGSKGLSFGYSLLKGQIAT